MVNQKLAANPLKTKVDLTDALREVLAPLEKHMENSKYGLKFWGGGSLCEARTREIEALLRPLWGIAPLIAGGGEYLFFEQYLKKIKLSTYPSSDSYWGDIDLYDQRMVEMAAIAYTLMLVPGIGHENLFKWLGQINHHDMPKNNWRFFRILVNLALRKNNQTYDEAHMHSDLEFINSCYLDNGWYNDGEPSQIDYYVPFAMHFYGLLYATWCPDCKYSPIFIKRAREFAQDFAGFFDVDGVGVPFGRSMTYRFAQSSFWGALAFANVEALPWSQIKFLALQNLRYWFKQDIFSDSGELTIGYLYPNLVMGEGYNAFGSPYWALKSFILLALDATHPFWQAEEEKPNPPSHIFIPEARSVLQRDDSQVQLFPVGQHVVTVMAHTPAKYAKFVYSSIFGFSVQKAPIGLGQGAFDNTLAVSEQDDYFRMRDKVEDFEATPGYLYSKWRPWPDVTIDSYILPKFPRHIRLHIVNSKRALTLADGGFAINRENLEVLERNHSKIILKNRNLISKIECLSGNQEAQLIRTEPNTNLMHPNSSLPCLVSKHPPGKYIIASSVSGYVSVKEEII